LGSLGIAVAGFYRLDALLIAQPKVSKIKSNELFAFLHNCFNVLLQKDVLQI